ncbi:MAG TPA: 50S ribosomal protein L6 [Bacteroidia bacterium]|nr:50S ribosomal protein L6 [Bacteroidia bacterium]
MSRIGKQPIVIPKGTEVTVQKNVVNVKGPKGQLSRTIDPDITVAIEDGNVVLKRPSDQKRHKAMHGLYRALINNMIHGVSLGYKTTQEVVGVGFRVAVQGQIVDMTLGYSHTIIFELPKDIKASATAEKGKAPSLILESADKELLGMVASKIRSLRKPDVYKGKGVRFQGEQLRIKPGKSAAGSGAAK